MWFGELQFSSITWISVELEGRGRGRGETGMLCSSTFYTCGRHAVQHIFVVMLHLYCLSLFVVIIMIIISR